MARPGRTDGMDVPPAGAMRERLRRAPDRGTFGRYTDLDRPTRIGFTWSCTTWPDPTLTSQVLVTLAPHGDQETLMTIAHSALTPDLRAQHLRGWRLIAQQLEAAIRTHRA